MNQNGTTLLGLFNPRLAGPSFLIDFLASAALAFASTNPLRQAVFIARHTNYCAAISLITKHFFCHSGPHYDKTLLAITSSNLLSRPFIGFLCYLSYPCRSGKCLVSLK